MINLDIYDKKILWELDLNGRIPVSHISKKLKISKDAVNYRINKLEKTGFIKGYYTLVDLFKAGFISIRIYLKFIDITVEKEKEINLFLVNNKKVFFVGETDGKNDLSIATLTKSMEEFEEFYNAFQLKFKEFIESDEIAIFTKVHHFHRAYILGKKKDETDPEIIGLDKHINLDETDENILRIISGNARIKTIDIAIKLNIPATTIAFRLRQLEKKKIIHGYRAMIDFSKLGYEYYKVDIYLKNISRKKEFIEFAKINPNIVLINQTIGGTDFEFDIEVENKNQLFEIMNELRISFPEIRKWEHFSLKKYNKLLYYPEK